jgi:hypothetical protein
LIVLKDATEQIRKDANGNVGIGVTPSAWKSNYNVLQFNDVGALFGTPTEVLLGSNVFVDSGDNNTYITSNYATMYRQVNGAHIWYRAASGTAGGTISFTTSMALDATGLDVVATTSDDWSLEVQHTASSLPYGMQVYYSAAAPNDTGSLFFVATDNSQTRFTVRSNGGIANFQSNDVNLSDESVKNSFTAFGTPELSNKSWEFGKRMIGAWGQYKYNDQTHSDWNNGYIAQKVKTAAGDDFPELVEATEWNKDSGETLLTVYDSDLMHIVGANVTQAQFRIEALEALVQELTARLLALETK